MDELSLVYYHNFIEKCNEIGKAPSIVAEEMGLKRSTVTAWKKGRIPRDATIRKVANYFGCAVEDLLSSIKNAPTVQNDGRKTAEQELFDKLDPSDRAFILAWMAARVGGQPSDV